MMARKSLARENAAMNASFKYMVYPVKCSESNAFTCKLNSLKGGN